ncbi:hypothetical protein E4U60_007560 [Claviceps pazoutovae]|uniref:Amino-acid acetyltransferase, mitochondrial n=1 Tax=Claviceps pazoutovae TaxID=1649127 RepID=A0A9P7M3M8_9HYPO|nr:hypothetical protein E4U60_007560 [Claviceps pazoutovae]
MTWSGLCRQAPYWSYMVPKRNLSTCSPLQNNRLDHHTLLCTSAGSSTAKLVVARVSSARFMSASSVPRAKQQTLDRDVIVSVLESAATRRDARNYLQKYTSNDRKFLPETLPAGRASPEADGCAVREKAAKEVVDVAVVKLRLTQEIPPNILSGVAKTLTQLRVLGLVSLVIVDCGASADRQVLEDEALRLCGALDSFGTPGARLAGDVFIERTSSPLVSADPIYAKSLIVDDGGVLTKALQNDMIVVIPSMARSDDISAQTPVEANESVLALTRYLTGLQTNASITEIAMLPVQKLQARRIASVERVIILDPLGGTPMAHRPDVTHRLINLEQEYDTLLKFLTVDKSSSCENNHSPPAQANTHAANLRLAQATLSLLPTSSSALITTPQAAANIDLRPRDNSDDRSSKDSLLVFDGMVITRKQKNPLLHNLLTNRPVLSPSLPLQCICDENRHPTQDRNLGSATLVKRGMPLTIYPDPRKQQWYHSGSQSARLTDKCIDLPRLVYLIENSFSRKLDVQGYLNRIDDNLAGIIIAGEYEGAAILTWESPASLTKEAAHHNDRYVPYLDKFAVLKSQQGGSSVADIVFNAMVQDCFPNGVCWRSRKNNPVNKWYFERSRGTCRLSGSDWAMFWTTSDFKDRDTTLGDYESVCRGVKPSWVD